MTEVTPKFGSFNEAHFSQPPPPGTTSTFDLFPRLSTELRLRVWELSLQSHRLLSIELHDVEPEEGVEKYHDFYQSTNRLGNVTSGSHYQCKVTHQPRPHALFSTCSESRSVAQRHFRVALPQQIDKPGRQMHLNPEHDFLKVVNKGERGELITDLLFDLKAQDLKNVGLLHLVMDHGTFEGLRDITPDSIHTQSLEPLKDTLLNLRSVWGACLLFQGARVMGGPLSGTRNYKMKLNRSTPIFSFASDFEWLSSDPRPIELDLDDITVFEHPNQMKQAWAHFEGCVLGEEHNQPLRRTFSFVLAEFSKWLPKVVDTGTMKEYLDIEAGKWAKFLDMLKVDPDFESEERRNIPSVAGMWVFPGDTFDTLHGPEDGKLVAKLAGCKPELLVARLDDI